MKVAPLPGSSAAPRTEVMANDDRKEAEGEDEVSVVFSFWPEQERPLEEEVRLSLLAAHPDFRQVDELEITDEIVWGFVLRPSCGGADVVVWAESRGDFSEDFLRDALPEGPELDLALRARWLIGVETSIDPRRPQASYQEQLAIVERVTVPGLVAIYDESARVVRSGAYVKELVRCPAPPRTSVLFGIHTVPGEKGSWVHTHGLFRAGLPEIDLFEIADDELPHAFELASVTADALVSGFFPDAAGRLALGDGLVLRATEEVERGPEPGSGAEIDDDHLGRRIVLQDPRKDGPPRVAMRRVSESPVVYRSAGESEREREVAMRRYGTFGQLFALHRKDGWRFHAKFAFDQHSSPETREHLWFEALELKPGRIRGRLLTAPLDVAELAVGTESWVPLTRLSDWLVVAPTGSFDPETAPLLLGD